MVPTKHLHQGKKVLWSILVDHDNIIIVSHNKHIVKTYNLSKNCELLNGTIIEKEIDIKIIATVLYF